MKWFCDRLAFGLERLLALALIAVILLNFINGLGRYLTGLTLVGADEIELYVLISLAFVGAAVVTWHQQHLRMDVLVAALPTPIRTVLTVIETVVMIGAIGLAGWQSFLYAKRVYSLGTVSDSAGIPTWIPHSSVVVSFALIALFVVVRAVRAVRGSDAEEAASQSPHGH